ncbi:MAG: hypothetical protein ABFS24_09410 [Pseudomonadota bacterium]
MYGVNSLILARSFAGAWLLLPAIVYSASVERVSPDTGLSSWKSEGDALEFKLVQVLPDYVRAVYAARGLPKAVVNKVSSYCVFGTILHNRTDRPLSYRVADWRYITADGVSHRIRTKSEWVSEWRDMGIAFRWSMLPDDQTFEVGDWGQGFTTIALEPGSRFALEYSWTQDGRTVTRTIKEVRCAPAEVPEHE